MTEKRYYEIVTRLSEIIAGTEFEGHVFTVGGCERDRILKNPIKDIDLVVDILNGGIKLANFLKDNGYTKGSVVVYEHFGTAMFTLKDFPNEELEAVQTRSECYHDMESRNPDTAFGTIQEDCHRRDFTVNAIYRNVSTGEVLDLNGNSFNDIEFQILRTCGEPNIIFNEDPLRILRLLRFHAKLGFNIETETLNGAINNADRLSIISQERITDEFTKILKTSRASSVVNVISNLKILKYVYNVDESYVPEFGPINIISLSRCNGNYIYGLASLLSEVEADKAEHILRNSKYSNDVIKEVMFLWKIFHTPLPKNDVEIRKLMFFCKTADNFDKALDAYEIMDFDVNYIIKKAIKPNFGKMLGYKLPINGNDIMEILSIEGGPIIKTINDELMEMAFINPFITKEDCAEYIKNRK